MHDGNAVPVEALATANLVLDRLYRGGTAGNTSDDPIAKLVPVGNQGGFRFKGSVPKQSVQLLVLYTSGVDHDWPDTLDPETGDFTYFGDNKIFGADLHETRRGGNLLLRHMFEWTHAGPQERLRVPPILLFQKAEPGRSVRFRGLLVPGSPRLQPDEELVALWRTTQGKRFQNYRSHFTVLDVPTVSREWINQILAGNPLGPAAPKPWVRWVQSRLYAPLQAPRTVRVRSVAEQYPARSSQRALLQTVYEYFKPQPTQFEHFAAQVWLKSDPNVASVDVTRPSRDGGRDGVGVYTIGPPTDQITMDFALEAKCYEPFGGGLGVKPLSRLISRIKHREFGVFITTAHVSQQAYEEIRSDGHPIIIVSGADIVAILERMDLRTVPAVQEYLAEAFPLPSQPDDVTDGAPESPAPASPDVIIGPPLAVEPVEQPLRRERS